MFYYVRVARAIHSRKSVPFPVVLDTVHTWVPIEIPWWYVVFVRDATANCSSNFSVNDARNDDVVWQKCLHCVVAAACRHPALGWLCRVEVGLNKQKPSLKKKKKHTNRQGWRLYKTVLHVCVAVTCRNAAVFCYRCCLYSCAVCVVAIFSMCLTVWPWNSRCRASKWLPFCSAILSRYCPLHFMDLLLVFVLVWFLSLFDACITLMT